MQYPLANAASCIGVKNLSNTCVRIKIYSVMKKCESKTMPYIWHDASCLVCMYSYSVVMFSLLYLLLVAYWHYLSIATQQWLYDMISVYYYMIGTVQRFVCSSTKLNRWGRIFIKQPHQDHHTKTSVIGLYYYCRSSPRQTQIIHTIVCQMEPTSTHFIPPVPRTAHATSLNLSRNKIWLWNQQQKLAFSLSAMWLQ